MWKVTLPPPEMEWEPEDHEGWGGYEYQSNVGMWYAKVEFSNRPREAGWNEGIKFNREGECVVTWHDDWLSPEKAVKWAWKKRHDALDNKRQVEGVGKGTKQSVRRASEEQTLE